MRIRFAEVTRQQRYDLIIQTVIPRPIAWTLTRNASGTYNLAPFSYFNAVCADPPMIIISIGWRRDRTLKDTRANIMRDEEFVVHIASTEMALDMTETSLPFEPGISEVEEAGLELIHEFGDSHLPRVSKARVALLCRRVEYKEIGTNKNGLILAEVLEAYYADEIVSGSNGDVRIDAKKLAPLSRIGGEDYVLFGEIKTVLPRSFHVKYEFEHKTGS